MHVASVTASTLPVLLGALALALATGCAERDRALRPEERKQGHAEQRVLLPALKPGEAIACEILPISARCEKKLWACVVDWMQYGSGGGTAGTTAIFGWDPDQLEYWKTLPSYERVQAGSAPNAVQLSWMEEKLCGWCQAHAWDCAASRIVEPVVDECFRKSTGAEKFVPSACSRRTPTDTRHCDAYTKCLVETCDKAQTAYESSPASWPEAVAEIAAAQEACADCGVQASKTCEVVAIDPCAGRVAYTCRDERGGKADDPTNDSLIVREESE